MNRSSTSNSIVFSAIFLVTFLIGLRIINSDLYWGESSLLTVRGWYLGGGNPPGYPVFISTLKLLQLTSIGDIAFRSNLISALFYSFTSIFIFIFLNPQSKFQKLVALLSMFIFIFHADLLFAVRSCEIYSFNLALILMNLIILQKSIEDNRFLILFCFLMTITAITHMTALLFIPGILLLLLRHRKVLSKILVIGFLSILLALSIYLHLPIRESVIPLQVWGNSCQFSNFIDLVTASEESTASLKAGLTDHTLIIENLRHILLEIQSNYTWVGCILIIIGLISILKNRIQWGMFSLITFIIFLLMVSVYHSNESQSFFLPAQIILIFLFYEGLQTIHTSLKKMSTPRNAIINSIVIILPVLILGNLLICNHRFIGTQSNIARHLTTEMLSGLKPNDVVLTRRSDLAFLAWYKQDLEHFSQNPIIFQHLLSFKWYYQELNQRYPSIIKSKLLSMKFEDSWYWNRAVTAFLTNDVLKRGDVIIPDPQIISDIEHGGLSQYHLNIYKFFGRLSKRKIADQRTIIPSNMLRADTLSLHQLSGQYYRLSEFFEMLNRDYDAISAKNTAYNLLKSHQN